MQTSFAEPILALYEYLQARHWRDGALTGPDPGLRFNFRIWRFLKSYTRFLPWHDDTYFLQGQGYWIWDNWKLYARLGEIRFRETAVCCTERILREQKQDGSWEYPLREWKDRVATVDGDYAARGLLLSYEKTGDRRYRDAAVRWYDFLVEKGGFQNYRDALVIRYFAGRDGRLVPNNVTLTLTLNAELRHATGDPRFSEYDEAMIRFLEYALRGNGEFPYAFATEAIPGREHFLCYQYNCFQFLDLVRYWELTGNERIRALLEKQITYIRTGLEGDGHSRYSCDKRYPDVTYYTAVMSATFIKAGEIGLGAFHEEALRAARYLLARQNRKGGFPYSRRNYGILGDRRSYPRYQAMILKHLLLIAEHEDRERYAYDR
ncbi:hypothetical protein JXO52_08705 [bacterium]|nr:hypothetical protein [bacterium]